MFLILIQQLKLSDTWTEKCMQVANGQREAERVIQISIETEFVLMELFIAYLRKND